jgi:hypothetical protein
MDDETRILNGKGGLEDSVRGLHLRFKKFAAGTARVITSNDISLLESNRASTVRTLQRN